MKKTIITNSRKGRRPTEAWQDDPFTIWVKERLMTENATVGQLADAIGLTRQSVNRYIYGEVRYKKWVVLAICSVFNENYKKAIARFDEYTRYINKEEL